MYLTPREAKLVEFLRLKQRAWDAGKWAGILASCLFMLLAAALAILLSDEGYLAYLAALYLFSFGFFVLIWTAGQWHGQPYVDLLLRVIDELQNREIPGGVNPTDPLRDQQPGLN